MNRHKFMGRRYDGGKSPLSGVPVIDMTTAMLDEVLVLGKPDDHVVLKSGAVSRVKDISSMLQELHGVTVEQYAMLPPGDKNRIMDSLERELRKTRKQSEAKKRELELLYARKKAADEREELHRTVLWPWSQGPLTLEKPQASSLHHLINYNKQYGDSKGTYLDDDADEIQNIVVEHNWAKALPPSVRGEWRMPFEKICWEFRISGVRVLACTFAEDAENPTMVIIYGAHKMWVSDDFVYSLGGDTLTGKAHELMRDGPVREFRRVAELVYANIRAACIMLDAPNVCEHHTREPDAALVAKARRDRVTPPRKYMVVRLMDMERRVAHYRKHGGGVSGTKQGGHWRRATWVHYDDQDSGQVQYVNDGGFIVSKTWRRWHFAGDPERMIEKEYRL